MNQKNRRLYPLTWKKVAIAAIVLTVILVVVTTVVYIWVQGWPPSGCSSPTISLKADKDCNNWSVMVIGISGPVGTTGRYVDHNASTFVIKRGDLTLVSLGMKDKLTGSTNIDPLTGNVTDYDIYTLSKEGYIIYFYDKGGYDPKLNTSFKGVFNAGDTFYIVNNGLRSGDVFELWWYNSEIDYNAIVGGCTLP